MCAANMSVVGQRSDVLEKAKYHSSQNCQPITARDFAKHHYIKCLLGYPNAASDAAYLLARACLIGNHIGHFTDCPYSPNISFWTSLAQEVFGPQNYDGHGQSEMEHGTRGWSEKPTLPGRTGSNGWSSFSILKRCNVDQCWGYTPFSNTLKWDDGALCSTHFRFNVPFPWPCVAQKCAAWEKCGMVGQHHGNDHVCSAGRIYFVTGESLPLWHSEPFGFVFWGEIPLNSNGLSLLSSLSPYNWWHFVGVPWYTQVSHLNNGSISTVWGLRKLLWSTSDARDAPHTTFLLECGRLISGRTWDHATLH